MNTNTQMNINTNVSTNVKMNTHMQIPDVRQLDAPESADLRKIVELSRK